MGYIKVKKSIWKICMVLLISVVVLGFPGTAEAATYVYLYDGSVPVYYTVTTTNSITLHIADAWNSSEGKYQKSRVQVMNSSGDDWYGTTVLETSGSTYSTSRRTASKSLMTGLTPGTTYTLKYDNNNRFTFNGYGHPVTDNPSGAYGGYVARQATTDPNPPTTPTFSNITPTGATVNWTTNGNGSATKYKLYRGESASGPWTTLYDGTNLYFSDVGLAGNTTYYYRLGSYVSGGQEWYATIISITTATDPTVAAAEAAKSAAEASLISADQAKTYAQTAHEGVQTLVGEFNAYINTDTKDPIIAEFAYAISKATITSSANAEFTLLATDNSSLRYRYRINNGEFTEWADYVSDTININLGMAGGLKKITVQVSDPGDNIATASAFLFKL